MFLIFIVNREFGVADNGDFSRYIGEYASKPVDLQENWPAPNSEEWNYRFFKQPLNFWSTKVEGFGVPWFTSASWFWTAGKYLNDGFFSENVFNARYAGLLFFLLHAYALFFIFNLVKAASVTNIIVLGGAFLIFTDARISAFYNSFYAESVPILATLIAATFFLGCIFSNSKATQSTALKLFTGFLVIGMLFFATLAKRQYLYFLLPLIIVLFFFTYYKLRLVKYKRILFFSFSVCLVIILTVYSTMSNRVENTDEVNASRITSYHALYYGILPHSKDPLGLIEKLGLPLESRDVIGRNAWNEKSSKLIMTTQDINLRTFLKAIYYEPAAFMKSVMSNADEVGNFDIPLGMVYGTSRGYPPTKLILATKLESKISGRYLFYAAAILAGALIFCSFGLSRERQLPSRMLAAVMLSILLFDVIISVFDGQQEVRKHVLISGIACYVIFLHASSCWIFWLTNRKNVELTTYRPVHR